MLVIIKAAHGHMGVCFTIFFTCVIEIFHSKKKKGFLSNMVLFLGFLDMWLRKSKRITIMYLTGLEPSTKREKELNLWK